MKTFLFIFYVILLSNYSFGQKWENTYGYPGTDESFKEVIETYDNGYLICSSYEQMDGTWLIKTDINGNIIWEKILTWDVANLGMAEIDQGPNGEVLIASAVTGSTTGFWPIITKLDSCGEKVWCRVYTDYNYNYGWFDDVLVLDNGDVVALGYLDSDDEIELIFLYYIDSDGNLLWRQGFASREDYPHIRSTNGDGIKKYVDNYINWGMHMSHTLN